MDKALELRQQRAALITTVREMVDQAEAEKRGLTAEEEEQFRRMMTDVDDLLARAERLEAVSKLDSERSRTERALATYEQPGSGAPESVSPRGAAEYRTAFWGGFRKGFQLMSETEARALSVGTNVGGGFLVPDDYERRLVELLIQQSVMRTVSTVITTSNDRAIPVETGKGSAIWGIEGSLVPESDPAFGQRMLTAHKVWTLILISTELMQDAAFDLEGYVARLFATRIGVREEEAFVVGTGVGQPRGITLDAPTGVTAAGATAVTADELIRLFHSLPVMYRTRGTWLLNDATILAARLLKDTTNQYLWQSGLQAGQPDRLLGRPVLASPSMPTMAAGQVSVVFGDLSAYWIGDRVGRTVQRLGELYATTGQVGFIGTQRVDGLLVMPDAVRRLIHP